MHALVITAPIFFFGIAKERRMVHATYFYLAVIVLSIGTVASYFIPLP